MRLNGIFGVFVKCWAIVLPFLLVSTLSFADEVIRKNGRRVKGMIVEKNDSGVRLEIVFGSVVILRDDIMEIKIESEFENLMYLARQYLVSTHPERARVYLKRAEALNPDSGEVKKLLEETRVLSEKLVGAEAVVKSKVAKFNEEALKHYEENNLKAALRDLRQAFSLDRDNEATVQNLKQLYLNYAWQLWREDDREGAVKLLTEGVKTLPASGELPILLGEFYSRQNDFKLAIRIWEEQLSREPDNGQLRSRLEEAYRKKGNASPLEVYYADNIFRVQLNENFSVNERRRVDEFIASFTRAAEELGEDLSYFPPSLEDIVILGESNVSPLALSGIFYDETRIIVYLPDTLKLSARQLEEKIVFTVTEYFLHSQMKDYCPRWLRRAYALRRSGGKADEDLLAETLEDGAFIKLRRIEDMLREKRVERPKLVEAALLSFLDYMVESYGERFLLRSFKDIAAGEDYEDALEKHFSVSFAQMEMDWMESLEEL